MRRAEDRVIEILMSANVWLSQRDLMKRAKCSQPAVSRALSILRKESNLLEKKTTNPFKYRAKNAYITMSDMLESSAKSYKPLTSEQMYAFLATWSETAWEPKVVKSLRNIPHAIAQLFSLAVEAAYGAEVTKDDLVQVQSLINETRQDVVTLLDVINRLANTKAVFDPDEMPVFLSRNRDIEVLQRMAHKVRTIN